jgi:hypothetical protein
MSAELQCNCNWLQHSCVACGLADRELNSVVWWRDVLVSKCYSAFFLLHSGRYVTAQLQRSILLQSGYLGELS